MFASSTFQSTPSSLVFAPNATKEFPRSQQFATWEAAFDSTNRMVIGYSPYIGKPRRVDFFNNPTGASTAPDGQLNDFDAWPIAATFDSQDNLYVYEANRGQVRIYKTPFSQSISTTAPTPVITSTPLPTPTPSANPAINSESPYSGLPINLPGKVEVENYNIGGEGVSYHDVDTGNNGGAYRPTENVDLQTTVDTGGGYIMGWVLSGEWERYSVNVTAGGTYTIQTRVASPGDGGNFHIEFNGVNKTGSIHVPNTGDWDTWTTVTIPNVTLQSGIQIMKVVWDTNGTTGWVGNINWINVVSGSVATPTPTVAPTPIPTLTPVITPAPTPVVDSGSVVTIYAAGTASSGVYPTMSLMINGITVKTFNDVRGNPSTRSFQTFSYSSPTKVALNTVRVYFQNDKNGGSTNDRNLVIDKINIDGLDYQTENPSTFSTGTWTSGKSCTDGYKKSEWLMCKGYFQY
jgi:hypothetical protein